MFNQNNENGADDSAVQQAYQDPNWQHPGAPLDDNGGATPDPSAGQPAGDPGNSDGADSATTQSVPVTTYQAGHDAGAAAAATSDNHGASGGLDTIKRQALSQLTPIVDRLDQTPEEKFRTLMMMIQSGDDQSLIQAAYAAAGEIQDETARAQALLDVVNEINYFNSQNQ